MLGPLPERPGANRANPYPTLASLDLLERLRRLGHGDCGNSTPYIDDEPSPYINEAQREQIRLYAFGGEPVEPAAARLPRTGHGVPRASSGSPLSRAWCRSSAR